MVNEKTKHRDAIDSLTAVLEVIDRHTSASLERDEFNEGEDARELESKFGKNWRKIRCIAESELSGFESVDDTISSTLGPPRVRFVATYPETQPVVRLEFEYRSDGYWEIASYHHSPEEGPKEFVRQSGKGSLELNIAQRKKDVLGQMPE